MVGAGSRHPVRRLAPSRLQAPATWPSVMAMATTVETAATGRATRALAGLVRRFKRVLMRFILQPTFRLEDELAARPGRGPRRPTFARGASRSWPSRSRSRACTGPCPASPAPCRTSSRAPATSPPRSRRWTTTRPHPRTTMSARRARRAGGLHALGRRRHVRLHAGAAGPRLRGQGRAAPQRHRADHGDGQGAHGHAHPAPTPRSWSTRPTTSWASPPTASPATCASRATRRRPAIRSAG